MSIITESMVIFSLMSIIKLVSSSFIEIFLYRFEQHSDFSKWRLWNAISEGIVLAQLQ